MTAPGWCREKKQNMPMFIAYSALQTSLMNKSGYKNNAIPKASETVSKNVNS